MIKQPILKDFLDKWVYPTGFTGAGVEFRLRQTERCLPLWDKLVGQAIQAAKKDLQSGSAEYKAIRARAGYAAEGPFMSLKQMSTQILSVSVSEQAKYIDLQRMRAPFMSGAFPFPVKYGYAMVGEVEEGPPALQGRLCFALYPHQTAFNLSVENILPLPDGLPPQRAVLAANMETALNAV